MSTITSNPVSETDNVTHTQFNAMVTDLNTLNSDKLESVAEGDIETGVVTETKIGTGAVTTAKLEGGTASPGSSKYYGTNNLGTKGFHDLTTNGIFDKSFTSVTKTQSTTAEQVIYTCTIPANLLGTNGAARIKFFVGDVIFDDNNIQTLKITAGGSTILSKSRGSSSDSITSAYGIIECIICSNGLTSSQKTLSEISIHPNGNASESLVFAQSATTALDSTASIDIVLSVQYNTTSWTCSFTTIGYIAEII